MNNIDTNKTEKKPNIPYHMPESADTAWPGSKLVVAGLVAVIVAVLVFLFVFLNKDIFFPITDVYPTSEEQEAAETSELTLEERFEKIQARFPDEDADFSEEARAQMLADMEARSVHTPESAQTLTKEEKLEMLSQVGE